MKKILFIAPNFYNYHHQIKKALEESNFKVDYFDDRPSTSFLVKSIVRVNKNLLKRKIKKYFNTILEKAKTEQYDIVLVIYGQSFSKEMFQDLRKILPNAHFIFYMYDPLFSMPDRLEVAKVFDKAYTFDWNDSKQHNDVFELLPIFYAKENYEKQDIKYDYLFITTMMPGKFLPYKKILSELQTVSNKIHINNFIQSKTVLCYYKMKYKEFKHAKAKEFVYKRISLDETNSLIEQSNIIIDIPKEGQTGLTTRTIECLAANKKIITTNETVKNYDFYRPENIYVYKDKIDFNDIFFKSDYVEIPEDIKKHYCLSSWIKTILKTCKE